MVEPTTGLTLSLSLCYKTLSSPLSLTPVPLTAVPLYESCLTYGRKSLGDVEQVNIYINHRRVFNIIGIVVTCVSFLAFVVLTYFAYRAHVKHNSHNDEMLLSKSADD